MEQNEYERLLLDSLAAALGLSPEERADVEQMAALEAKLQALRQQEAADAYARVKQRMEAVLKQRCAELGISGEGLWIETVEASQAEYEAIQREMAHSIFVGGPDAKYRLRRKDDA